MDGVVLVADAKSLRRSLALALEVAEFGVPMVVNLNMVDEARVSASTSTMRSLRACSACR